MKWISVEDRLPEENEPVVLINVNEWENCHFDRNVWDCGYLNKFSGGYWSIRGQRGCSIKSYTHWASVSPPPTNKEEL